MEAAVWQPLFCGSHIGQLFWGNVVAQRLLCNGMCGRKGLKRKMRLRFATKFFLILVMERQFRGRKVQEEINAAAVCNEILFDFSYGKSILQPQTARRDNCGRKYVRFSSLHYLSLPYMASAFPVSFCLYSFLQNLTSS